MRILVMWAMAVCLMVQSLSCTSGKKSLREHKGTYLESVKLNFEAGEDALKAGEYDKAISYFQFVRSKYPFSKYAALSDLKIADAKFAQKKWLDAASAYEVFVRLHPRHEDVGFASYRVGASYFHAVPSDFFLLPPSTSRDQSFTKEALAAIERFILQFPTSAHIDDAKTKQRLLFSYLAQHNMHVAAYYVKRGRYEAAIARWLSIDELYPETTESAEALFLSAEALRKELNDHEQAMEIYARIVADKQNSPYVSRAQVHLNRLLLERESNAQESEE